MLYEVITEGIVLHYIAGMAALRGQVDPGLAVKQDRLSDPVLREMFLEKVFTLRRFRELLARRKSREGLVAFHTDHKLLLLSHGRKGYTELGRLVARAKEIRNNFV